MLRLRPFPAWLPAPAGAALAGAWLALAAAPAAAHLCEPRDEPDYAIEVLLELPEERINRSLSRAELGDLAFHGPREQVLGVMQSHMQMATRIEYRALEVPAGLCLWAERVTVTLRYTALDIYVAAEYLPESCPYRAILAHERQHAKIARSRLESYVPRIRVILRSLLIPRARKPLPVDSMAAGEAKIDQVLERLLGPTREEIVRVVEREQGRIDTPEAYRRVRQKCDDW